MTEEDKINDSFLFTKKKKFFMVFYKGITFTDEESLLNFERKEKLDNILDDKELKDGYQYNFEFPDNLDL
jgi:hypothetical protein